MGATVDAVGGIKVMTSVTNQPIIATGELRPAMPPASKKTHHEISSRYPGLEKVYDSPDIYIVRNFLQAATCEALLAAIPDALVQSEQPELQFDSTKLLFLVPLILSSSAFLSHGDAIVFAETLLKQSLFVLSVTAVSFGFGQNVQKSQRSSDCIPLGADCNTIESDLVEEKVIVSSERLLRASRSSFERPCLTRYRKGQQFKSHNDASLDTSKDGWDDLGGQRLATLIIYLNNVETGGGTYFGTSQCVTVYIRLNDPL